MESGHYWGQLRDRLGPEVPNADLRLDLQCDQAQPSCSRCTRLEIDCTGAGVRRFIFVDEAVPNNRARRGTQNRRMLRSPSIQVLQQIPPNALDSLTALMVSKISVKDPRYDVGWAYGPFLSDVPRRLGHSAALDAATEAFVLSLPPISNHREQPDSNVLESYIVALEATRTALADPVEAKNVDTLCAAYFLLVCQVRHITLSRSTNLPPSVISNILQDRIGVPGDIWVHVVGINHMLNDLGSSVDHRDAFDMSLIVVLCSIIVSTSARVADRVLTRMNRAAKSSSTEPWKSFRSAHAGDTSIFTSHKASSLLKRMVQV